MNSLDVLLVLPPVYQTERGPDYNPKEPMGLMYLAAALREKGYSVEILDGDVLALTIEETLERILNHPATVIGFSVWQRALPSLKLLVEGLRERGSNNAHVCCGGFTATLNAKYLLIALPGIDSIVMGEGEVTFCELVKRVISSAKWKGVRGVAYREGEEVIINKPAFKPDINSLPFPTRDLLPICLEKTNYATILGSRGCYGNCTFCSNVSFEQKSIGRKWRGRDSEDIVAEIEMLHRKYGVTVIKFNDPNLFGPGKEGRGHVVELCREIIKRGLNTMHFMGFCRCNDLDLEILRLMEKAGFERLLVGIESANPEILRRFRKGVSLETIRKSIKLLRSVGISIVPGFLIFNPYTTIGSLERDIAFLEEYGFMPTLNKALRVYNEITIQHLLSAEGKLIWRDPLEGYHEYYVNPEIASIYMGLKRLFIDWIDPLKKTYQDEWWHIKKAPSFKTRKLFYKLEQLRFHMELNMLKALIIWTKEGFSLQTILQETVRAKEYLAKMEKLILEDTYINPPEGYTHKLSERRLAVKIQFVLTEKSFSTFPEHYRWSND